MPRYREQLGKYPELVELIAIPKGCSSSCHLFQILVANRDEMILALKFRLKIYPGVHYTDNTLYRMYAYAQGTCPRASYVSDHVISLPMHMRLTYDDVRYICDEVIKIAKRTGPVCQSEKRLKGLYDCYGTYLYLCTDAALLLRPLTPADSERYRLCCAIRIRTAAAFFYSDPISVKSQQEWYQNYLRRENDYMFAVCDADGF